MLASRPTDEADEPSPSVERTPIDELLLDSALWWIARAATEAFSRDRIWACFECGSCDARFTKTFRSERSPWTGGSDAPLYRDLVELEEVLSRLATERRPDDIVDPGHWADAHTCACGAPSHRTNVAATALFHSMAARSEGLVIIRGVDGETRCFSLSPGEELAPVAPTDSDIERALGRPLTLATTWAHLLEQLPPADGHAVGSVIERGVFVVAAGSREAVRATAEARLEGTRHIVVFVDPSTIRSRAWPDSLSALADQIEAGVAVALVLARDVLVRRLRALARTCFGSDVDETEEGLFLRTSEIAWPISDISIGQNMVQLGRTLPEACSLLLAMAAAAGEDRLATLRTMVELVPGSFDVDGSRATGIRADGSRGRTIDLTALPAFASALPPEDLVREAAFLLDAAPPWADRARVCPCGSAATVERRLVAWPWSGTPASEPFVLDTLGPGAPHAAIVLALCCDRHVRVPAATEVARLGLSAERIEARLVADAPDARSRVRFRGYPRGSARPDVVVAQGAHLSGIALDDARVTALYEALKRPFGDAAKLAMWAIGTDRVALTLATDGAEERVRAALEATDAGGQSQALLRREALLTTPVGRFDVIRERG